MVFLTFKHFWKNLSSSSDGQKLTEKNSMIFNDFPGCVVTTVLV